MSTKAHKRKYSVGMRTEQGRDELRADGAHAQHARAALVPRCAHSRPHDGGTNDALPTPDNQLACAERQPDLRLTVMTCIALCALHHLRASFVVPSESADASAYTSTVP